MLKTPLKDILRTTSKHLSKLKGLGIKTAEDLLLYFPRTYNDRSDLTKITELRTDQVNTVRGTLTSFFSQRTKYGKYISRGVLTDDTGSIEVIWFNQPHLKRILFKGMGVILTGKLKFSFGKMSMQSPAYELVREEQIHSARIVPTYH